MRPFFPTVRDFAAATTPHFQFLVSDFGYSGPTIEERTDDLFDVAYYGRGTAVLLNWDTSAAYFACNLAPRLADGTLDPDYRNWMSVNEVVAARGAAERWISQRDLDDVDLPGYGTVMDRAAENLREFCDDVLRGDWSVRRDAQRWLEDPSRL
ncbi:MAG TPA: hypothetical protein VH371_04805 [Candidatus Limnocylindrales bacterium]|jgi:hypothetical protein